VDRQEQIEEWKLEGTPKMPTELDMQEKLVEAVKKIEGGYGFKLSNKFLAGIPDLFLSTPSVGPVLLEVKMVDGPEELVLLTPLQRHVIIKLKAAGTAAGIVAIRPEEEFRRYTAYVTTDHDVVRINSNMSKFIKVVGEPWPIEYMMMAVRQRVT
jgi:hypothetical protein